MNPNFFESVGRLLVHSAWQFLIVGVLAWLLGDIFLRRCSSSIRYTLFAMTLLAMTGTPAVTWVWLAQQPTNSVDLLLRQPASTEFAVAGSLDFGTAAAIKNQADPATMALSAGTTSPLERTVANTDSFVGVLSAVVSPWLSLIVGCWFFGVCILASRLAVGWWRIEQLKQAGREPMEDSVSRALASAFERARRKLGVRRPVRLLVSQLIDSPVVVGAIRSVILVPTNFLGGVAIEHVEAILAHELAHVRRYDFLVNLFQTLVETVFFYHPVVWWVSYRMRTLREHCCDDIAAAAMESPAVYSRALVAIEELRGANLSPALGIRDGDLVSRVRRLIGHSARRDSIVPSGPMVAIVIATLSLAALVGVMSLRADEPVDEKEIPEAFIANISEDLSIELVAIKPHRKPITLAWRPDGIHPDQPIKFAHSQAPNFNVTDPTALDVLIRYKGLYKDEYPFYRAEGAFARSWIKPYPDGECYLIATEKEPSASATLTIGVPDPDWGPWMKVDTNGETLETVVINPRYQEAYQTLRPLDVRSDGEQSMLRWAHDLDDDDLATVDFVAVDKGGKKHSYSGATFWTDANDVDRSAEIFDLPIEKISHIEYRLRPTRHWVTFSNLSLRPGQRTNVDISVRSVPIPEPVEKSTGVDRPEPDPKAQRLGEQIHKRLTAVSTLPAFLVSTRRSDSYYSNPDGVIGLQGKPSLENLKKALEVRDFDESLSMITDTWAWKDKQVVALDRHKYVSKGKPYDQPSARTWDGTRGWYQDSSGQFGRYRNLSDCFQNHYFRPSIYMYLGDHRFNWATADDYPTFFVSSTVPATVADYQSLPDEDFAGERCFVIRSIRREEQFWISQESRRLLGSLTFISQGVFTPIHEMESLRRMSGQTFESRDAAQRWLKEVASDDQKQQFSSDYAYLHRDNQRPHHLTAFSDYREVAPGIELPHTEWRSSWMHEGDKYKYNVVRLEIERVTTQPDLAQLIEQALPKKGDTINDWRFSTHVNYEFDPEMPESSIHDMVDKAQAKQLENQRAIDNVLNPLKAMVGQKAPKLSGESMVSTELPEVASGSRTLLHFWAVWCGPCKNDIPALNRLANQGMNVIGVHVPGTQRKEIESAIKETGMEYPVILGTEEKRDGLERGKITGYPVGMFPCCVLIDKDGKVEAVGTLGDVLGSSD